LGEIAGLGKQDLDFVVCHFYKLGYEDEKEMTRKPWIHAIHPEFK
jgi:hypothetical protein